MSRIGSNQKYRNGRESRKMWIAVVSITAYLRVRADANKTHTQVTPGKSAIARRLQGIANVNINPRYPPGREVRIVLAQRS